MKIRGATLAEFLFGASVIIACSVLLFSKIKYFPDFETYDLMISKERFFQRYINNEPLSAYLMWLSTRIADGAYAYYVTSWLISACIVIYTTISYHRRMWFTTSVFLLFNPLNIIAFETPRHLIGMSVFVLAMHLSGVRRWLAAFSIILFHNLLGLFVLSFLVLRRLRRALLVGGVILAFAAFFVLTSIYQYLDLYFMDADIARGRGQLAYTLAFFFVFALLTAKARTDWLFIYSMLALTSVIYLFSQYGYRLFQVCVAFAFLGAASVLRTRSSTFILQLFTLTSVAVSMIIVELGLFGYG